MQRNEKEKKCWGLGKKGGEREEVPCGRYCDSRKRVQTHFADLVNNPCQSMLALQETASSHSRVSLPPEAGSRLPPVLATSPRRRYLGAAGNLRGPAPRDGQGLGARNLPPRLLPAPLPSSSFSSSSSL